MSCSLLETGDEDTLTVSYEFDKSEYNKFTFSDKCETEFFHAFKSDLYGSKIKS